MLSAINTKVLIVIALAVASIAGSLAYRNAKEAEREAAAARARAQFQQAIKNNTSGWGSSANTVRDYRPK